MHAYSSPPTRVKALGAIAVVAVPLSWAAARLWDLFGVGPQWWVSAPALAGIYAAIYQFVDHQAWRWRLLHTLNVIETPAVDGTYVGDLVTTHDGSTLPVKLRIKQRWTDIGIDLTASTSTSESTTALIKNAGPQEVRLIYTYRSKPLPGLAHPELQDHDGTAEVTIDIKNGTLVGRYYTARGKAGSVRLKRS